MKALLFIDASGAQFFKRKRGLWKRADRPTDKETLWIIADLPDEALERLEMPMLLGRDRTHFLERRLATAFPESRFRAAIPSPIFRPGQALLTGLSSEDAISRELGKIKNPIAGVWGLFMLMTALLRRNRIPNIILVLPGQGYLRILVTKQAVPVVTRCIHRLSEIESPSEEIQRTRLHLEKHRLFEQETIPPVLYLGDPAGSGIAGLMPLPDAMKPKGDASYLHALFDVAASTPNGQIAPLPFRLEYLGNRMRMASHVAIVFCLLAATLFAQHDISALAKFDAHGNALKKDIEREAARRRHFEELFAKSGTDLGLMRQATGFAEHELDPAPTPDSVFRFLADVIAGLQEVRIRSMRYELLVPGENYCHKALPATDKRHVGLQFSILLTGQLSAVRKADLRKQISARISRKPYARLIEDPADSSDHQAIQSGSADVEDAWCMLLPWQALREMRP